MDADGAGSSETERPEAAAFELLIRATETIEYPKWDATGEAALSIDGRNITAIVAEGSLQACDFTITFDDPRFDIWHTDMGEYGSIAPVCTAKALDDSWTLGGGFIANNRWHEPGGESKTTIRFSDLEERFQLVENAATAVVYVDAPVLILPDLLPVPKGLLRPHFLERGLRCHVDGHEALVRNLEIPELSAFGRTVAIAWAGPPLLRATMTALHAVASFLFGGWVQPAMQISVDRSGALISRRTNSLRPPLDREHTPPIQLHRPDTLAVAGRQFGEMVARGARLVESKVNLDVAISHHFKKDDQLDTGIRDITLALSSLVESPFFDPDKGKKTIGRARFKDLKSAILTHLQTVATPAEAHFVMRVGEVLPLAKAGSTTERRNLFWKAVGFEITREEKAALEHRNSMSHKGYIGFDYEDERQWQALTRDQQILRTLVNRVILALLRYEGDALDYVTGGSVHVAPSPEPFDLR